MTKMKMLGAVIILSAAVATPVFAQDAGVVGAGKATTAEPMISRIIAERIIS